MARYAVLIYANDSAHAPEATTADTASCDDHADQLVAADSMRYAFALTPRDMATALRADSGGGPHDARGQGSGPGRGGVQAWHRRRHL